ncbi:FAD-dependent oxidoreductase [Blastococcus sp. DSM 46786]|uniref:FAD-dependent oxidoreductase n=1 Tax=Blastococcus sp. DSM 46786 TaxID=1798227 RepID=UPI001481B6DC|nr:FAD-dependent oxidoreductase [Blastococcus sp. DSM 46786]
MPPPDLGATDPRRLDADVLVLGGGIVGVTTALLLQRAGRQVAIVSAEPIGRSVTTHSTVKVTYGHGALYSKIKDTLGLDAAAAYAQANVTGFQRILDLVDDLGIDCTLERGRPHVVYTEEATKAEEIEKEAAVAQRIGLPVSLSPDVPLPFEVIAALHFQDQATFHPGRYLAGLAEAFVHSGGMVVEGVWARDVDEDSRICHVETTAGRMSAGYVVVATQYPFLDRGGQFARMKATRSYGIAGVLPGGVSAGMTINVGSPIHSTRTAHLGGEDLLIVVGEGHEVGHVSDTGERWTRLQEWARDRFGVTDLRYHWSAEETSTLDHVPFTGRIAPGSERVFTACGFDGWGMTNGTASALLIRDLILGQDNPWAATFDARRAATGLPGKEFVKHNVHVAKTWVRGRVGGAPKGSPADLERGEAAVLEVEGEQTAAYRDEQGTLHAVSSVCTHMACTVAWNDGEKSWDCPCHGSRFTPDGDVLHGPASSPLPRRNVQ